MTDVVLLYLATKLLLRVLLPLLAPTLLLLGKGIESPDRHCLVQLLCAGRCRLQTVPSRGERPP
jgi:hypothetical protein